MKSRMIVITFKIPRDLLEQLERYRLVTGETRSAVIRRAIEYYLNSLRGRRSVSVK